MRRVLEALFVALLIALGVATPPTTVAGAATFAYDGPAVARVGVPTIGASPPPGSTLTRIRSNGDVVRYHPGSNTFGVMDANGAPRTFFRPDPAVHGHATNLDYFYAQ
jgi:hypothetical protein